MKKKIIAAFLATVMTAGLLAGCGGGTDQDQEQPSTTEGDTRQDENSSGGVFLRMTATARKTRKARKVRMA